MFYTMTHKITLIPEVLSSYIIIKCALTNIIFFTSHNKSMRFLFFLSSFFICAQITAQPSLQWYPEQWMPSSNNSSGFSVNLAPLQNFIPENAVKSYFQRYKCKWSTTDKSGLVWKSEPVIVDEISPSTIQIFYSFQKAVDTSKLKILFQSVPNTGETNIPESNYLKLLSSISNRLIYDFYMNKIEQQTKLVKDTQALVKATEGDIDQAKKAIEKSEKEIQNSKQKINELEVYFRLHCIKQFKENYFNSNTTA